MGNSGGMARLALCFSAALIVAGCESTWQDLGGAEVSLSDAPAVSGNTFDRYNDIAVVPPHSENLSISYRYELKSPPKGEAVSGMKGPVWFYAERSAAVPESFFQIGLVSGEVTEEEPTDEDEIVETVRLGTIRYDSTLYCVDLQKSAPPAAVAGFVGNVASHGYGLSKSIFIRHYEGQEPGLDGRWLSLAFVLDITRKGYDCAMIGDPNSPDEGFNEIVDDFKEEASRTFEVVR